MRKRGFEVVSTYLDKDIHLPIRQTSGSAGYDIEAAERTVIPSIWQKGVLQTLQQVQGLQSESVDEAAAQSADIKPVLVPTGIKVYMPENEYLQITCRSSNPLKRSLVLPNGVGIVDSDYYNNAENEGELFVQLLNFGFEDVTIEKGERIAQGTFLTYQKTDDDVDNGVTRQGGFGSSGQN